MNEILKQLSTLFGAFQQKYQTPGTNRIQVAGTDRIQVSRTNSSAPCSRSQFL